MRTLTCSTCRAAVAAPALILALLVAAPPVAAAAPDGTEIYEDKCIGCHGPDGSGNTPMGKSLKAGDLRSAPVQSQTDLQLIATVTKGKGKMQAFGKKLAPDEIAAVVTYLRTLKAK
jgi:mono/diheme cytochrome c family protein